MFERIRSFLSDPFAAKSEGAAQLATTSKGGGSKLPPLPPPKVDNKQISLPGHMTATAVSTSSLPKNDLNLANIDITGTYRFGNNTSTVLRNLIRANPDLGAALSAHLRMGIPERYIAPAYNPDGSFNVDGTRLAMEILMRFDTAPGYDTGFSTTGSIRSVSEGLAKDLILEGAMAVELVLNKARQPASLAPVAFSKIKFYDDHSAGSKTLRPVQDVGGVEIDLDKPNFFAVWLDPSLLDAYPHPPMESAIQPTLASNQFLNDLRRLCQRHVYPRYVATLDGEKLAKHMPENVANDPTLREAWLNEVMTSVETAIQDLGVEDALVLYDFVTVKFIEGQDGDVPETFNTVKDILNGKIATGAKSMPALLGHGNGTQNVASTETMIAMLTSNSMVRIKLQEIFSKNLTLACKLFGIDVSVKFEFDDINLRPELELEAFKAMKQSRILEQLSLGLISDEEACLRLTYRLPPVGYVPLAGTMFHGGSKAAVTEDDNAYSGTGAGGGQSGGGAATQSRKPKTPEKAKGSAK